MPKSRESGAKNNTGLSTDSALIPLWLIGSRPQEASPRTTRVVNKR
ncbi:hypothetical protein GYA13_02855 [Candidatus Kuenenbacteria bacterium]|nr:hypothetical protein [Candidatus Kuenenbacteria bacterium]